MLKTLGPENLVFSLLMLYCQKSHIEAKNLIKTQFFISWDLPSAGHAIGIIQRNHYKNDFFFGLIQMFLEHLWYFLSFDSSAHKRL